MVVRKCRLTITRKRTLLCRAGAPKPLRVFAAPFVGVRCMQTYDLHDSENRLLAFEIGNIRIGRRGVCRVVQSIPGAELTRKPKFFSWLREAEFCEFTVDGALFAAEEPFGDNSRYWIGPKPPKSLPQTRKVRDAFASY